MLDFLKKKKEETPAVDTDTKADDVAGDDSGDKTQHGPDVVGGVPVELKDKLAEIRGEVEKDFDMVEADDDGNIKKDEKGNPIIITDADEISAAKDGDTPSGEADETLSAAEEDKSVAEANTDISGDERATLDTRLEDAGRKMGWPDDKIISVAQADITILEDLADRFEKEDKHRQEKVVKGGEDTQLSDPELSDEAIVKLREKVGDDVADLLVNVKKNNEILREKLGEVDKFTEATKKTAEQQTENRRFELASELFDNNVEAFPEFGKTADLPLNSAGVIDANSSQMKERDAVYRVARMFQIQNGGTFSAAMNEALSWHSGRTSSVNTQRRIVKDLNSRKKRFSPKPSSRKMVKVYKNKEAKGAAIVSEAKKAAGIT